MVKAVLFDWGGVLRSKRSWRRYRQMYDLAKELQRRGLKVGIISNINPVFAVIVRLLRDYRGFEPVILSYAVKARKPKPQIFEIAVRRLGCKPSEVIFVDNLPINIQAAKKAGMQTVLFKNSKQAVADIQKLI